MNKKPVNSHSHSLISEFPFSHHSEINLWIENVIIIRCEGSKDVFFHACIFSHLLALLPSLSLFISTGLHLIHCTDQQNHSNKCTKHLNNHLTCCFPLATQNMSALLLCWKCSVPQPADSGVASISLLTAHSEYHPCVYYGEGLAHEY